MGLVIGGHAVENIARSRNSASAVFVILDLSLFQKTIPSEIRRKAMTNLCHELWHMRTDEEGRDYEKLLGIYSTQEKAQQGLGLMRDKPYFRDFPECFEILEGGLDETDMTEGFVTVWGDEAPDPNPQPPRPLPPLRRPSQYWPNMDIYLLWHCYADDRGEHELMLGGYSSIENTEQGLKLLRDKPGFRDHPDGFAIVKRKLDQTYLDMKPDMSDPL